MDIGDQTMDGGITSPSHLARREGGETMDSKTLERIISNDILAAVTELRSIIAERDDEGLTNRGCLRALSLLSACPHSMMYDVLHGTFDFDQLVAIASVAYNDELRLSWFINDRKWCVMLSQVGRCCNVCSKDLTKAACSMLGHTRFNMS